MRRRIGRRIAFVIEMPMRFGEIGVREPLLDERFKTSERRLRFGVLRRGVPKRKIGFLIIITVKSEIVTGKNFEMKTLTKRRRFPRPSNRIFSRKAERFQDLRAFFLTSSQRLGARFEFASRAFRFRRERGRRKFPRPKDFQFSIVMRKRGRERRCESLRIRSRRFPPRSRFSAASVSARRTEALGTPRI